MNVLRHRSHLCHLFKYSYKRSISNGGHSSLFWGAKFSMEGLEEVRRDFLGIRCGTDQEWITC